MDKLSLFRDGFGRAADVQAHVISPELNYRLNDGCSQVIVVALFPQRSTWCHCLNVCHWNACQAFPCSLEESHGFVAELWIGGLNCEMLVKVSSKWWGGYICFNHTRSGVTVNWKGLFLVNWLSICNFFVYCAPTAPPECTGATPAWLLYTPTEYPSWSCHPLIFSDLS